MCLSPRQIVTRSRYISLLHQQPFIVNVPCNHCAECDSRNKMEWYYRIYHEWLNTYNRGGYVLFQTLSYSDDNLPMLCYELNRHGFDIDPTPEFHIPCFSRIDIDLFFKRLRRALERKGVVVARNLRYWICGEYGTSEEYVTKNGIKRKGTHRPHYHVLFFVTADVSVFQLNDLINRSWNNGLIDRLRLSGSKANYFPCVSGPNLGLSNYVAKYVQKSSPFESTIQSRINSVLDSYVTDLCEIFVPSRLSHYYNNVDSIYNRFFTPMRVVELAGESSIDGKPVRDYDVDMDCSIRSSYKYRLFRNRVIRLVGQFHNQSQGFGSSALDVIDVHDVIESGYVTMPDKFKILRKIPLPRYFRYKLFYEKKIVNGKSMFVRNSLGKIFYNKSLYRLFLRTKDSFDCYKVTGYLPPDCDTDSLSRYVVYKRGRVRGMLSNYVGSDEVFNSVACVFNYSTPRDVAQFHGRFVSSVLAHCGDYYFHDGLRDCLSVQEFVGRYVYFDSYYEMLLYGLSVKLSSCAVAKQNKHLYLSDYHNRMFGYV